MVWIDLAKGSALITINDRLQKVNLTLAKITRRLGFLRGRAFYRIQGTNPKTNKPYDFQEIPILSFEDGGFGGSDASGTDFVSESNSRNISISVNRSWLDIHANLFPRYILAVRFLENSALVPVSVKNQAIGDDTTTATINLFESKIVEFKSTSVSFGSFL